MIHLAAAADDLEFETHAAHFPQPLNEIRVAAAR
jgi:hypothetical protein